VWALEQESSRRGWSEQDDQDVMVPWVTRGSKKSTSGAEAQTIAQDKTYHRYYHLYRKNELEENIVAAGGRIVEAGYEKDNWWAIASRNNQ
jgi:tRNA (uracil-5-)-methyltransferase TRM9